MTVDLRTSYLGLELRSPLVASPSPLTGELDGLLRLEAAAALMARSTELTTRRYDLYKKMAEMDYSKK